MDNFIERIKSEKQFRETIIDSLCSGIRETSQFRDLIEYVISNKLEFIQQKTDVLYEDEDDIVLLILHHYLQQFVISWHSRYHYPYLK